jgi:hypothetical protein
MTGHAKATNLEQETGLPKANATEAGFPNPNLFSGLTERLAAARLFLAPQLSKAPLFIATKMKAA